MLLVACSGQPSVTVSGNSRMNCGNRNVTVSAEGATIVLTGTCSSLFVTGSFNEITADRLGDLTVPGSHNHITWRLPGEGGTTQVSNTGKGNILVGPGAFGPG